MLVRPAVLNTVLVPPSVARPPVPPVPITPAVAVAPPDFAPPLPAVPVRLSIVPPIPMLPPVTGLLEAVPATAELAPAVDIPPEAVSTALLVPTNREPPKPCVPPVADVAPPSPPRAPMLPSGPASAGRIMSDDFPHPSSANNKEKDVQTKRPQLRGPEPRLAIVQPYYPEDGFCTIDVHTSGAGPFVFRFLQVCPGSHRFCEVRWNVPGGGRRRLRVENVTYQPEAAGRFDL